MFKCVKDLLTGQIHPSLFLRCLADERRQSYQIPNPAERFLEPAIDGKHWQGLDRVTAGYQYFTSDQMLRQHHRADWNHVPPELQLFAARLVQTLRKRNFPFYVHTALRTKEAQNAAKARGNSRLSYPVAPHCQGKAVDIVHSVLHWDLTKDEWATVGHIGKQIARKMGLNVTWGGDWRSPWDPAHWELVGWQDDIQFPPTLNPLRKTPVLILKEQQGHL